MMNRNTVTMISELKIGDRFYKAGDKNKTVFQKVDHKSKRTQWQTYTQFAIEAKILGRDLNQSKIEEHAKAFKRDTSVIFLRHN